MKNRTSILLICFLVALAQGDVINWAGSWDQTATASDEYCYPAGTVLISQTIGSVTASWVWANSKPCQTAGIANQKFSQTSPTPQDNTIQLQIKVGKAVIDGTFKVVDDDAVFASNNGASSSYSRRQQMVNWSGNWDIVTQDDNSCNPDGTVKITQTTNYVTASWTWASSKPCTEAGLAGKGFSKDVRTPSGNAVAISVTVGAATLEGIFAVIQDQAIFASTSGATATFVRRQELVNWVGTWDVTGKQPGACYPDQYITIIPSGGQLTSQWVWEKSDACTKVGLAGKTFTQTQPVPKGKAVFLDFIVGTAYVSGLFTASGDTSVFASIVGASATFSRRGQMVNWSGVFDIATKDTTACYPDGSITVTQTDKNVALSWTWAKTDACTKLALNGQKYSKTVDTPAGNGITLDVSSTSTQITGLLTLFLDGAVFSSTNGASSTYTRRQENADFEGTWTIQTTGSTSACYPADNIIITQSNGKTVASWTWATTAQCNAVGLGGKTFSQTETSPKGKAIFLDIVVGDARISGLFTVNGENAVFASINGASATFLRTSKPGGWTGIIIAIIVVLAIAAGGYYFYIQQKNKKLQGENLDNSVSGSYTKA